MTSSGSGIACLVRERAKMNLLDGQLYSRTFLIVEEYFSVLARRLKYEYNHSYNRTVVVGRKCSLKRKEKLPLSQGVRQKSGFRRRVWLGIRVCLFLDFHHWWGREVFDCILEIETSLVTSTSGVHLCVHSCELTWLAPLLRRSHQIRSCWVVQNFDKSIKKFFVLNFIFDSSSTYKLDLSLSKRRRKKKEKKNYKNLWIGY